MKRVVVDRYGGPEVLRVVEEESPRPGPGEVLVRVLAAGVSFTDAQLRAGTYIPDAPKPPFTPGYELVGVVEELGLGCSRLRAGDRIGALTVWGADAERVCVPESGAVDVPDDLDPGEVLSLLFPYMTAYQVLHRTARARSGEAVLAHGAAGRVGVAALELGALAGLRLYGTASARDREQVAGLGAVAIDYRNEDSWRGCARRRAVSTLSSTASAARSRCAPSVRCARWEARHVRPLQHAQGREQGLEGGDQVVRRDRHALALGQAFAPPAERLPPAEHATRTRCSRARRRGASSCSCHKRSCTT